MEKAKTKTKTTNQQTKNMETKKCLKAKQKEGMTFRAHQDQFLTLHP